jgi:hypothetical protein
MLGRKDRRGGIDAVSLRGEGALRAVGTMALRAKSMIWIDKQDHFIRTYKVVAGRATPQRPALSRHTQILWRGALRATRGTG